MFNLGEFSMKKTLVAIAALAAVSAFAQSTATLSGVIRFGYQKAPNASTTTKADTGFALTDATFNLGVVEDLGGGLKAAGNVTFDTASSAFGNPLNRRNTSLGLMGGFGTIGFAQTRSSDLITKAMVAPSNLPEGLYNTSGIVARGGMDGFSYTTPNMSGFTAGLALIESTNDGTVNPGRFTTVLSADYSNGPLAIGVAFKNTGGKNGFAAPAQKGNTELFATYDLGVAKLGLGFDSKTNAGGGVTAANAAKSAVSFGVAAPFGPATVGLNYAKRGTAKVTEAAVNYALSKRTSFNVSVGNQSASAATAALVAGTGAAGGVTLAKQSQYRISLAHTF
jgi:predicted porin